MPLRFSIVVPTFNRCSTLEVVLPKLLALNYPPDAYEILLSDSGSTDGTDQLIARLNSPNIRYMVHENNGRSGARNVGVRDARYEMIMFTDADIIADPDLLKCHAEFHATWGGATEDRLSRCAVVGCEIQVDTVEEYEKHKDDPWKGRHLHRSTEGDTRGKEPKRISWLYFLTGNASVSRQALLDVGLFDEQFTGYGHEDLELGYRLQKYGLDLLYHPGAVNFHWHPVSFDERCQKMKMAGFSTVRFWRKHRDPGIKFRLGMTPVSLGLHSLFDDEGWFIRQCRRKAPDSHLHSEMLLQYHYLSGVKEGLKALGQ